MKRFLISIMLLVLVGTAAVCSAEPEFKGSYLMATASATGNYYNFGSALSAVVNNVTGANLTVTSTGGSTENARLLADKENEFAMIQSDVYSYARTGIELFAGEHWLCHCADGGIPEHAYHCGCLGCRLWHLAGLWHDFP